MMVFLPSIMDCDEWMLMVIGVKKEMVLRWILWILRKTSHLIKWEKIGKYFEPQFIFDPHVLHSIFYN